MKIRSVLFTNSRARQQALFLAGILLSIALGSLNRAEAKELTLDDFMVKNGYQVIPMVAPEFYRNRPKVPQHLTGKVNGKRVRMAIATQNGGTMIDTTVKGNFKIIDHKPGKLYGAYFDQDEGEVAIVVADQFEAGSVAVNSPPMATYNLHREHRARTGSNIGSANSPLMHLSEEFDVVLGTDFLRTNHAILHVLGNRLYVRKEKPDPAISSAVKAAIIAAGWTDVPFAKHGGHSGVYLDSSVNGHPALWNVTASSSIAISIYASFRISG